MTDRAVADRVWGDAAATRGTAEEVAVVGAGTMGFGIAAVLAAAGHAITLMEPDAKVRAGIPDRLRAIAAEGVKPVESRITLIDSLDGLQNAKFVIEAVPEDIALKRELLAALLERTPDDVIVASNTSSIEPDLLMEGLPDQLAARFLVAHFWNPPYVLPLVELVAGARTDGAFVQPLTALLKRAGLRPVALGRAVPGFIGNRLQMALMREALHLVESGAASPEVVDEVMRSSLGPRWSITGPFEAADLGGLHIFAAVASRLFPTLARAEEGAALLANMAASGRTGERAGEGFYKWTEQRRDAVALRRRQLNARIVP